MKVISKTSVHLIDKTSHGGNKCWTLSTNNQSWPEGRELFYLVGMFRTLSPGDCISGALRKLLQGGRGYTRLYTTLWQREQAVWILKIRYQLREFSILCVGRCKPLDSTEFIPFICIPALWGQICFLVHLMEWETWQRAASCILPAPQPSLRVSTASAVSKFWEPPFPFWTSLVA